MNNRTGDFPADLQASSLRLEANEITESSLNITDNLVVMCDEILEIGANTNIDLDIQGKKLEKVNSSLDKMDVNIKTAEKHLTGMESWFGFSIFPRRRGSKIKDIKANVPSNKKSYDTSKRKSTGRCTTDVECKRGSTQYVRRINNDSREDKMEENMQKVADGLGVIQEMAKDIGIQLDNHNEILKDSNIKGTILNSKLDCANKRANALHEK